jgi:hypothetical protein
VTDSEWQESSEDDGDDEDKGGDDGLPEEIMGTNIVHVCEHRLLDVTASQPLAFTADPRPTGTMSVGCRIRAHELEAPDLRAVLYCS